MKVWLVALTLTLVAAETQAGPITWQWTTTVSGSALTLTDDPIDIPTGTPMVFHVTWDSEAENLCPQGSSAGTYPVMAASMLFMGQTYTGASHIESNSPYGNCVGGGAPLPIFRFYPLAAPVPNAPTFFDTSFGAYWMALYAPSPATLGGLPGPLTSDPYPSKIDQPWGLEYYRPDLHFGETSLTDITAVPEPSTMLLVGSGMAVLAWHRRRQAQKAARP